MWFLYRPDAVNIWKDEQVQKRYPRYKGIMDGNKIARYLLTKKFEVTCSLDQPLEKLWEEHDHLAEKFQDFILTIDREKTVTLKDFPTPKISFLDLKEKIAYEMLKNCHFCERRCQINRSEDKLGYCRLGKDSLVSSAFLHTGEESILVPSGTIFFTGCTFTCVFCQNHDISQEWCNGSLRKITEGTIVNPKQLALLATRLWKEGARNINLVGGDPTPNLHTIISALKEFNANITILWNSNNYQSEETTKLLLELIDFWLPDFKFWDNVFAKGMSGVKNYREIICRNIKLAYDKGSGEILIRHLILPGRVEKDTYPILEWCTKEIPNSMVNLMDQYHPDYLVTREPVKYKAISRRIYPVEWQQATAKADQLGIFWRPVS
ncbi:MAG: radical SAM protein [Candidatus Heimdallarchaeota archaeon]|nr:radical SAM protein [Candidatus Heimdallarchaeota archaeon]